MFKFLSKIVKKIRGDRGESIATSFLVKSGYTIITRNYRSHSGEVDIIAEKDCVLVFVEVKRRSSDRYGTGAVAVDRRKQEKIIKTAKQFCQKRGAQQLCRFDVIAIDTDGDGKEKLSHIENAFVVPHNKYW